MIVNELLAELAAARMRLHPFNDVCCMVDKLH